MGGSYTIASHLSSSDLGGLPGHGCSYQWPARSSSSRSPGNPKHVEPAKNMEGSVSSSSKIFKSSGPKITDPIPDFPPLSPISSTTP
jgi:hypothetical protein